MFVNPHSPSEISYPLLLRRLDGGLTKPQTGVFESAPLCDVSAHRAFLRRHCLPLLPSLSMRLQDTNQIMIASPTGRTGFGLTYWAATSACCGYAGFQFGESANRCGNLHRLTCTCQALQALGFECTVLVASSDDVRVPENIFYLRLVGILVSSDPSSYKSDPFEHDRNLLVSPLRI